MGLWLLERLYLRRLAEALSHASEMWEKMRLEKILVFYLFLFTVLCASQKFAVRLVYHADITE